MSQMKWSGDVKLNSFKASKLGFGWFPAMQPCSPLMDSFNVDTREFIDFSSCVFSSAKIWDQLDPQSNSGDTKCCSGRLSNTWKEKKLDFPEEVENILSAVDSSTSSSSVFAPRKISFSATCTLKMMSKAVSRVCPVPGRSHKTTYRTDI